MLQHIENNIDLLSRFFNFFSLVENKTSFKNIPSSSSLTYLILSHRYWLDGIQASVYIVNVSNFWDIYKEHIQNIHSYRLLCLALINAPSPALPPLASPPEFPVSVPAADTARARAAAAARTRSGTISCLRGSLATDVLTRTTLAPPPPGHRSIWLPLVSTLHVWSSPAVRIVSGKSG